MKIKILIAVVVILWIGMILAIGMESIVKFQTPTLTKSVAFDVGRTVFGAFNKAQMILLGLIIIGAIYTSLTKVDNALITGLIIVLFLQVFWLFPQLSERVDMILAGVTPPATYKHGLYGGLEVLKLVFLSVLGFKLLLS